MDNSFKSVIDQSNSILILLPTKPYFDQVAAGLSLYLTLKNSKGVVVTCPTEMTVEFNRLVGVNKIVRELGNKNLIIKFSDYKANDIERVSYDIEDRQFRLTVIPKTGIPAPVKDQVALSYSGISCDTVILVGGTNETHFPALATKELAGAKLVHLGNKEFSTRGKTSMLTFAKSASSVSEVVAFLMKESGLMPDSDVATNLLMGIEDGSEKFGGNYVNADTFEIVSELMRAGGRRQMASPPPSTYPAGSIPDEPLIHKTQPAKDVSTQKQPAPVNLNPQTPTAQKPSLDLKDKQPSDQNEVPKDWLKQPRVYKGTSVS